MKCPRDGTEMVVGQIIYPYDIPGVLYIAPVGGASWPNISLRPVFKCPLCGHSEDRVSPELRDVIEQEINELIGNDRTAYVYRRIW